MATFNAALPEIPGALTKAIPPFYRLKILTIFDIYKLQVGKLVFESFNNDHHKHSLNSLRLLIYIIIIQDMQNIVTSMSKG